MSDFQELIKNFERIRDYMRQFYIYGFKVRGEYGSKSARTYDNERRRIESYLSAYTRFEYTSKGKQVYINVDSKTIPVNPLYAAWKSKSFTDNDINLHFLLPDLLSRCPEGLNAGEASEQLSLQYGLAFDTQIVRRSLKEFEELEIFTSHREGKELLYRLSTPCFTDRTLWEHLMEAVTFFQGYAPFGMVGSTLMDQEDYPNRHYQFKHQFIVHTLEDGVLYDILTAIREGKTIRFKNNSHRSGQTTSVTGIPLKIFVSTQTGRRYLCLYLPRSRRFHNMRLDSISCVEPGAFSDLPDLPGKLDRNLPHCFGVSFGGNSRMEEIHVKLFIDEEKEPYIIERLRREGRGGELLRIRENEYLYSGSFYDTNELLSWVKSFTGRVLDIQGSNSFCIDKITKDWDKMYEMYCNDEENKENGIV